MNLFTEDFKIALSELTSKEKDKLILRLLRKDKDLTKRLYFELVDTDTVDEKRNQLEVKIITKIGEVSTSFYSTVYLFHDLKSTSSEIADHVKVTKDKFGEPYLNLVMLYHFLKENVENLSSKKLETTYKFYIYCIARTYRCLCQIQLLHEDYKMEFTEILSQLGHVFLQHPNLVKLAINNSLDLNWLVENDIPNDIQTLHKELRINGFLK